ncbi:hypothetical protein [Janthinobacterium sp. PC23-8]|uniref:hypothetical protein n=1 Tax=Janthinobacterium sp. PC23-8 TaxID=2012679 RepID=UPI000B979058|nr:hypothetical protein [Janthinobacterium sp. PC23-8]OYO30485.1 hypothetical protein CD932_04560 [Janthinobacterium sp. PC23-8]
MTPTDTIALEGSITQMRTSLAIAQGAMHHVRLSVARWRGDVAASKPEHANCPAMAPSQSAWHAAAQRHFLCWLAAGGFAQSSEEAQCPGPASQATASHGATDTKAQEQGLPAACCHNCTA